MTRRFRNLILPVLALVTASSQVTGVALAAPDYSQLIPVISSRGDNAIDWNSYRRWDTTRPEVAISSPANGDTVAAKAMVRVKATDNIYVTGVTFFVDDAVVGVEDRFAPYEFSWDTTSVKNGSHVLTASARDWVGNTRTSSGVSVNVNNSVTSDNLIANPSLETVGTDGNPDKWLHGGWGTNTPVFTYPVAGVNGGKAAKIEFTSYTSGDAKWYFADVPVIAGDAYTFSYKYMANVTTGLTYQFTKADGTVQFVAVGNEPASASWAPLTDSFVVPVGTVSMTVMASLGAVGSLSVDDYVLVHGLTGTFDKGLVTLTFDDAVISQFTDALPILNAAGVDGTFYMPSQRLIDAAADQLIANPSLEISGRNGDPQNWFHSSTGRNNENFSYPVDGKDDRKAARVQISSYRNGDAKWYFADVAVTPNEKYNISDSYKSTVSTEVLMRYTEASGVTHTESLGVLPSSGGRWQDFKKEITIPANTATATMFHQLAANGTLTVDNYSLMRVNGHLYMNQSEMLTIQSFGNEVSGHSKSHPSLPTVTPDVLQEETAGSRQTLLRLGATPVNSFAYPFGDYDNVVKAAVKNAGFTNARSVDRGFNTKNTDKYALKIQQVDRTTTVEQVSAWVKQAVTDKTWLILMFHQIDSDPAAIYGTTPDLLKQMVSNTVASGARVITMEQAMKEMLR